MVGNTSDVDRSSPGLTPVTFLPWYYFVSCYIFVAATAGSDTSDVDRSSPGQTPVTFAVVFTAASSRSRSYFVQTLYVLVAATVGSDTSDIDRSLVLSDCNSSDSFGSGRR